MSDLVPTPPNAPSPVSEALAMIERAARDPTVDVGKMQALQAMQFQLLDRLAIEDFNTAVSSLPRLRVKKNGTIDLGEAKDGKKRGAIPFAKWEDMDDVIRPLLEERGLFLTFDAGTREGGGMVITGTMRRRGANYFISASIPLPIDTGPGRNNLQAMGSTLSYGKRYTTEMLLNIVRIGEDDDGKRGGTTFISDEEEAELLKMCEDLGRNPADLVQLAFEGSIHHLNEIEQGQPHVMFKNLLARMIYQRRAKT